MAYPFPYTITDGVTPLTFIPVPGSLNKTREPDDRGGGNLPDIRAGVRVKASVQAILDEAIGGTYVTLANAYTMAISLLNTWVLSDENALALATGPIQIEVSGDAVQMVTITVG